MIPFKCKTMLGLLFLSIFVFPRWGRPGDEVLQNPWQGVIKSKITIKPKGYDKFRKIATEDIDGDGVPDLIDNCPSVKNPTQADLNGDRVGDDCQARIVAGLSNSCSLSRDDKLACWGDNNSTQMGIAGGGMITIPTWIYQSFNGIKGVAAGGDFICALIKDGTVACTGANDKGQLGRGTLTARETTPLNVVNVTGATAIVAGKGHACAVVAEGKVKCWGTNDDGQLGRGNETTDETTKEATPDFVMELTGVTSLATRSNHACATLSDGSAKCWGSNVNSQLGRVAWDTTSQGTPLSVSELTNAKAVSVGNYYSCALLRDGNVKCWGALDLMGKDATYKPTLVEGLSGVSALSAGGFHACAVLSDGKIVCWGTNTEGQLGRGTTSDKETVPASVSGINGTVIAVAAGHKHTCAVVAGESTYCWGSNFNGQLGRIGDDGKPVPNSPSPLALTMPEGMSF